MPDPFSNLNCIDLDALPEVFSSEGGEVRNARIGLDGERKHVRTATGRQYLDMLAVANAARTLDTLPAVGESYHIVMSGNFAGWDFVPAVLRLATPATIRELNVTTLGFNSRNAAELVGLIDAGQIERCTFIASVYYKSNEPEVWDGLTAALTSRGHRILAARCHAKILLMELTDGQHIVIESSANLRSCRNVEQCCVTNDADLLRFHRGWMQEPLSKGNQR